jgi:septal ring factor EnvC (AmiA/AmiB activator)
MAEQFVPEVPKADLQILLQDFAQARRDLFEERKNSERAIAGERERAKWEIERMRSETAQKVKVLEGESEALARALGRLQIEVDRLREENAVLRVKQAEAAVAAPPKAEDQKDPREPKAPDSRAVEAMVPVGMAPAFLPMHRTALVPPPDAKLGKSVPVVPPGQ